jgi:cell pole-organizing protein PopZ
MQQMPGPMSGQTLGGPQQQKQPQELVPPKPTTPLEAMALAQKANGGKPISAKEIPEWIKLIDQQKQMMFKDQMALNSAGTKAKAKDPAALSSRAETIADAIASGKQAPVLTGLYSQGAAVREALAKKGVPLEKMQLEYQKAQKQVQTLNGPQMIKFFGLANSVTNTMGEVKALAQEMKQSGVPLLNRAQIEAAMQLRGNSPEGRLATRYMSAVNTLKEEFANLAQGGYAPTEATWALADKQINGNFGVDQLSDSLDEATRLINYRVQAVTSMSPYAPTTNASGKKEEGPAAGPQKIGGDEDYAKLKSGDEFIAPDGSHRRKP